MKRSLYNSKEPAKYAKDYMCSGTEIYIEDGKIIIDCDYSWDGQDHYEISVSDLLKIIEEERRKKL